MGVKNYTSISCHTFLPHFPSFTPATCRGAGPAARAECRGGQGLDRGCRTWCISDDEGWATSSGQGGVGYMTGFAARPVPETDPLMTTPVRGISPGFGGSYASRPGGRPRPHPPLPYGWRCWWGFDTLRSREIPVSETIGIERLGCFWLG